MGRGNVCVTGSCEGLYYIDNDDFHVYRRADDLSEWPETRLMGELERYARGRGVTRLTIGVDAKEARNLAIYLHWGYQELLFSQWDEGELVLYYAKDLGGEGHAHG